MNIFTVDLEEWFCSHALQGIIKYQEWESLESRIQNQVFILLEVLAKYNIKATFFVLSWMAIRHPNIINLIIKEGHEIASHGHSHRLIYNQTPLEFKEDIIQSLQILTAVSKKPVVGYRAPAFSIVPKSTWALSILKESGILYDSSIYPTSYHPDYGFPSSPRIPYYHKNGLLELPLSLATIGGLSIPCSGGGYFRFLPYSVYRNLIIRSINQYGFFIFYIHPWEIDPGIPKLNLPWPTKVRLYQNLNTTLSKLVQLVKEFEFYSFEQCIPLFRSKAIN